jgi:very-long-chain ceramide synthase
MASNLFLSLFHQPFALFAIDLKYPDKSTYANDVATYEKKKKKVDKSITKFVEASWRCIFYSVFCIVGIRALFFPRTASWIEDTANYWTHWPQQHTIEPMVLFYYLVELGAYFHQLAWTEVTRSDAAEMIVHHLVTIMLIVFSYLLNFSRIGSVILLLHDIADVFLESAKCFNYISRAKGRQWAKTVCDALFAIFAITFFVTRLVLFPRYVIYDVIFVSPITFNNDWFGYWTFAGLLITLECLHIFWFYLVLKMIVRLFTTGIEKDERSDDEGDDSEPVQPKSPSSKKDT